MLMIYVTCLISSHLVMVKAKVTEGQIGLVWIESDQYNGYCI